MEHPKDHKQASVLITPLRFEVKLIPMFETGPMRVATLYTSFDDIVSRLGYDNVTNLDDSSTVEASWAFSDVETGRDLYLWCYMTGKHTCKEWSVGGDPSLAEEIFGNDKVVMSL